MPTTAILLGLLSALTWGAADFGGGLASKRASSFGVVLASHLISLAAYLLLALLLHEAVPPLRSWLFAAAAGLAGGVGLMLLYRALADGKMSIAAPLSALVAAAIPVLVAALNQGLPKALTLLGFVLALSAVWLLSSGEATGSTRLKDLGLPLYAGVAFGLFFVLLHQASDTATLWPIVAARIGSVSGLLAYARLRRQSWLPPRALWAWLALIGLVDSAGTVSYLVSARLGRLDVAAVLGSLYPGATVLLAWVFLKEHITRLQAVGILLALAAIALLTH